MAKIESKFTYQGTICDFIKKVGSLSFYSIRVDGREDEKLLITDPDNNVLARVSALTRGGAYGEYVDGYFIEEE